MSKRTKTRYRGITRLDKGRLEIRVKVKDHKTGQTRETRHVLTSHTLEEALREQLLLRDRLRNAIPARTSKRFKDYVADWLSRKKKEVHASTYDKYETIANSFRVF